MSLHHDLRVAIQTLAKKYPKHQLAILGDLQATIDDSPQHNVGKTYPRADYDILTLAKTLKLRSAVPTHCPDILYITRWGKAGGRGIDHIMLDAILIKAIKHAALDSVLCLHLLGSDHLFPYADLYLRAHGPKVEPQPPYTQVLYGKLVNLQLKHANDAAW